MSEVTLLAALKDEDPEVRAAAADRSGCGSFRSGSFRRFSACRRCGSTTAFRFDACGGEDIARDASA